MNFDQMKKENIKSKKNKNKANLHVKQIVKWKENPNFKTLFQIKTIT